MISKVGASLVKEAFFGGLAGLTNAASLSGEEQKALQDYYGVSDGAKLNIRNAIRGELGGLIGGSLGALMLRKGIRSGSPALTRIGGALGATGYGLGALAGSQKYSREHAREIMDGSWDKFLKEIDEEVRAIK